MIGMKEPRIRASGAAGLVPLLLGAGLDPEALARRAGLDPARLADPEAWLPAHGFVALFELAAEELDDPRFGLRLGLLQTPAQLGVLGYVAMNSPTVRVAFSNISRYMAAHQEGAELGLEREGDTVRFTYRIADPSIAPRRQDAELTMGLGMSFVRALLGDDFAAEEVWLEHDELVDPSEHRRMLGCDVRFGRRTNAIVLDASVLERSPPDPDPALLAILERHADGMLASVEDSLAAQVRSAIGARLQDGVPSQQAIARSLGMSPPTLRRRLDAEGSSFKQELTAARGGLAQRYLRDRSLTLTEIAFLLGYSDVSAFHRAFKRWSGSTPRAFREQGG